MGRKDPKPQKVNKRAPKAKVSKDAPTERKCGRCGGTYFVTCAPCTRVSRELRAMSDNAQTGNTVPISRPGSER